MKKLILIDGSNLMFRAYYATAYSGRMMKNSKGEFTNAVYAITNMLNLILKEDFSHILVAFDKGKATFRHKAYEAYKAQRKPMPDEFRSQLPYIKAVPDKLGITVYEDEAFEADDIIATLAYKYYDDFDDIEIISNDRDLFQLLNHKVHMRISKRGIEPEKNYTEDTLKEDLGLKPSQIPDLKGLMGDSSDNLPGVPGVGEKTALKLLHEYGDIETLLRHANELKGKLKERIQNNSNEAQTFRDLATVKTDADLDLTLEDLRYKGMDKDALIDFYEHLEFHSLLRRLRKDNGLDEKQEASSNKVKPTSTLNETDDIEKAVQAKNTTLILESFGENYHFAKKLGFLLSSEERADFIPYEKAIESKAFKDYLLDANRLKSVHDVKKMRVMLKADGLDIKGVDFDLLLAAYVLNPSNTKEDFKVIVSNFDYHDVPYLEDVYGKGKKAGIPEKKTYIEYARKKARAIEHLRSQMETLIKDHDQTELYSAIELPLAFVLADMESEGVSIDTEALKAIDIDLEKELDSLTEEIHELAGETFNIGSPKQLSQILFERLGLPPQKKTKTGYSTNVDVLKKLQGKHPIIDKLLRYRMIDKLKSAYIKGLSEAVHDDGKIHTIYKQAFTQTGRLSSIEPNLQTIPIRSEMGRNIRKVFIPSKGHVLIAADYSQIELRLLAHLANEKRMIEAFNHDEDIHTATGKLVFEKDELTANERRMAKAVNFGIIYGQTPWGLSQELGISNQAAKTFIERYYERFSGIEAYMKEVVDFAKENGYVKTMYNRRRYIPELNSKIHAQRELGKRTAMNAPLQGSAADLIKIAMNAIDSAIKEKGLKSRLILQIHDELVFDVPKDEAKTMQKLVKETMEGVADLKVPLTVDALIGENLDEAK
ncbi:MAG: DNA polymerase I [Bacillota bacterium]